MTDKATLPPIYQCSNCARYQNDCPFIEKMQEVLDSCPNIDRDTVKCKEYKTEAEWKDFQIYISPPTKASSLSSKVGAWKALEDTVVLCVSLGRKPVGLKISREQLRMLDVHGSWEGYKPSVIRVLEWDLEVLLDESLTYHMLVLYK